MSSLSKKRSKKGKELLCENIWNLIKNFSSSLENQLLTADRMSLPPKSRDQPSVFTKSVKNLKEVSKQIVG